MFKEDKEDILAQYNKMLDEADDEQALLDSFGSPTKLAVTISRTYKRSERKLAGEADSKEDKPAESEHIIVTPVKKEKPAEKPAEVNTGLSYADIIEEIRRGTRADGRRGSAGRRRSGDRRNRVGAGRSRGRRRNRR